ncbi:sodium/potassium/calcium exchanger 1-like isoform X2 [Clupea harengus]|uniref:Sodium/potassium/calcium exchanger 1 n=1 Tax=Clupea harengus TaxID=7950 RepID=A0A6P8F8M8_CLUHA|nr:sodium/potassium/calcium exchanger 1-like isoform X2 [Clupea harengus]
MYSKARSRLKWGRTACLLSGVLMCCVYQLSPRHLETGTAGDEERFLSRELRSKPRRTDAPPIHTPPPPLTNRTRDITRQCIFVEPLPRPPTTPTPTVTTIPTPNPTTPFAPPGDAPHMKGAYPEDLFTVEDRRKGWVLLHILGMSYMFVALAIVCDEFFVPALGVITDRLEISDDVAGATFMAAGGSAPELFTSLIGVFISHSNVGIGTIVGSAVFNILFVIGMCALFSRTLLHLTWWPLFRDVSFYILSLLLLIVFFLDSTIHWWESAILLLAYVGYVTFMKHNEELELMVKEQLRKHQSIVTVLGMEEPEPEPEKESEPAVEETKPPEPLRKESLTLKVKPQVKPALQRGGSSASLHNTTMRSTVYQLMIHTLNPLEGTRKSLLPSVSVQVTPPPEPSTSQPPKQEDTKEGAEKEKEAEDAGESDDSDEGDSDEDEDDSDDDDDDDDDDEEEENEDEEKEEPLSLDWPDSQRKQVTYLLLLPIVFPLWLTIPDVRRPASKKYFAGTFLGSIMWIGIFSYLTVWWAHQVGETIGISEEIMGLTILAAGTSVPDLITSVIVARKGLGDMAVSSSVGSNIFDITVGLPVPWLLYSMSHGGQAVPVSSNGLFCAIVLLFLMLLFVIISITVCRWKMSKRLGLSMFLLYLLFLVLSVLLEKRIILCPVTI